MVHPLPPCLILTAGLGTRLRPLTWLRAKPALPVAGVPLVNRILGWVRDAGVRRVVLNLHHLPETIRSAVAESTWGGLEIAYSFEDPILGSAGGPKRALPLLGASPVLVVNGDTLTDVDLAAIVAAHSETGALVTMAVVPNAEPERYGGVVVDEGGSVTGFVPRGAPHSSWHFVGVQALDAAALASVPTDRATESVAALYPRLSQQRPGSVRAYRCGAAFLDIGTAAGYLATSLALAGQNAQKLVDRRACVNREASVERSILWEDVTVGPGARLRDCIVTQGVNVPEAASFSRQILISARRAASVPALHAAGAADGLVRFPF